MSFYKDYPNRKDWRKPHQGSKAVDSTCQNHGSCPWCESNRTYKLKREKLRVKDELIEYFNGEEDNVEHI